jgi:sulfur carrier protein
MTNSVEISLNGEPSSIVAGLSLQQALELWEFTSKKVAVAINGDFVPRSLYGNTQLSANDQIDVVTPVGGG